jgi:hypothetical protein
MAKTIKNVKSGKLEQVYETLLHRVAKKTSRTLREGMSTNVMGFQ